LPTTRLKVVMVGKDRLIDYLHKITATHGLPLAEQLDLWMQAAHQKLNERPGHIHEARLQITDLTQEPVRVSFARRQGKANWPHLY
jgi:hypothetical protein